MGPPAKKMRCGEMGDDLSQEDDESGEYERLLDRVMAKFPPLCPESTRKLMMLYDAIDPLEEVPHP